MRNDEGVTNKTARGAYARGRGCGLTKLRVIDFGGARSARGRRGDACALDAERDTWIFIDGKLALDLGGLHQPLTGTIDVDTLGLALGESYRLDLFHAQRHTPVSVFEWQTNIVCFEAN